MYKELFRRSAVPQMVVEKQGLDVVAVNDAARELFGLHEGETFRPLVCRPAVTPSESYLRRFRAPKARFTALLKSRLGVRLMEIRAERVDHAGQSLVHLNFFDVTAMRIGERRLRESFREARTLLAATALILVTLDPEGRVTKWNRQAEVTFDIPREQAHGLPLTELPIGWDRKLLEGWLGACRLERDSSRMLSDLRYARQGGKVGFLKVICRPVTLHASSASAFLVIMEEITQYKILETQLLQSQKLESIGQLASGIAHEINTPVQYVSGNLGFLKDAFERLSPLLDRFASLGVALRTAGLSVLTANLLPDARELAELKELQAEIPGSITDSLEGIDRVAGIVGAMKNFSHPDTSARRMVDVNKAVESTLTISHNEWKYHANLHLDLDPSHPLVFCVPGEFNQVLLNVVVNAAHAMNDKYRDGGKGVLGVRTRREGEAVLIAVSDTGVGIPEAIRERIYDPFFTTKEVGKGTGQGLAIVHSVTQRHDGSVSFESVPGEGTTFFLRFPSAEAVR